MTQSIKLTDGNFHEELQSDVPVLVDFWAEWCGPCRALAPTLEKIAEEYDGKLKIGKLNVDENPALAGQYGVRSIPTMILFKDGKEVGKIIGALPQNEIESALDKALALS